MDWKLFAIPIISALIGWVTNKLAIKMLFRPYKPLKLPVLNWNLQGVIPKRQEQLAINLGDIVQNQLLSIDDVIEHIHASNITTNLQDSAKEIIHLRIMQKVPGFLPGSAKRMVGQAVEDILDREMPKIMDRIMDKTIDYVREDLKVGVVVQQKVESYNLAELEELILKIASRELKHIEVLGGVLGFIIGCFQLLIVYFL